MASLPGHFSFQSSQDPNQMLPKDSSDGAAAIELNRDRRPQPLVFYLDWSALAAENDLPYPVVSDNPVVVHDGDDEARLSDSVQWDGEHEDDNGGHFPHPLPHPDYDPCHSNVGLLKAELKAITNDRDILRRELNKMQNQLEGYKQLSVEKTSVAPSHNYEWLKSQCDQAMNELQSLKEQHSDTIRKCDNYKQQYENVKQNNAVIRSQYAEAMVVRQRLEQDREELRRLSEDDRREIDELRKHQREVFGQSGSFEEFSVMYDTLVGRYDSLKQDYETLRKQNADSLARLGAASAKVEELQEENSRLRKQSSTLYEESKMHQSLSVQAGHDQKTLVQRIAKAQQENDALAQQLSQALTDKLKEMKDASRLRAERNAITNEYKLIMSERDTVHKEMEHLHDINSELNAKVVALASEKSAAMDEIGRLRRMLGSALDAFPDESDRVKLEMEQEEVLIEFNRMLEATSSGREPTDSYMQNGKTKEMLMMPYSRGTAQDGNLKETDNLRKDLDKMQNELMDALHELEEAKQLRDWAFGERDKIVKERESIRTLCDKLRHERDSAVSELIGALRDSDELKRQKNDVMKELKELEEKYETLMEKEAHKNRLSTTEYSHSRDSAIDTDLQEWETETLELDIGNIHSSDLGFDLVGGANDPQFPNDPSIFVRSIQPSSAAYGKLKVSDQLLRVNDIDVSCREKAFIYQILHNSQEPVHIVIRRRKLASSRAVFPIHIYRSGDRELGINLEPGLYVSRIISGSLAAKEGNLAIGDRILNINGLSLENRSTSEAMRLLSEAGDHVVLNVLRYCQTPTSSLVSSMSMFSGTNFDGYSDGGGFRSPHDPAWKSPTDELNSDTGKLAGNTTLKSSGSQTDGLDSHHGDLQLIGGYEIVPSGGAFKRGTYAEGQEQHEKNLFGKAINVIARPFRSNRTVRDARSKSTHPFVNSSVIEAWRCQEDSPSPQNLMDTVPSLPSTAPNAGKAKTRSHGTWPKCRVHIDYTFPTESGSRPSWSASRRPHLLQMTRDGSNALPPNPADHKVPPLPPTRRDSFKRSASIKHSPQNSDAAAKYASAKAASVAAPSISHCDKGSLGDTFRDDRTSQDYVTDARAIVNLDCLPKDNAYPEASSRIVSCLCDPKTVQYSSSHPRTSSRPNAFLPRPDRNSQDFSSSQGSSASSWLSPPPPTKPTSLGVQPIYSPRPKQSNQDAGFLWPLASFSPGTSPVSPQPVASDAAQKLAVKPSSCAPVRLMEPALYQPSATSSDRQQTEHRPPYFSNNMSTVMQMHLMHGAGFGSKAGDSLGSHPASSAGGMRYSPVSPGARASLLPFESMLRSSIPETPDLEQLSSSSNRDLDCSMASSSTSPMVSNLNHRFLPPSSSSLSHQQVNELQRKLSSVFSQRPGHQFQERIRIPSSPSIVSSKSSGGAISSPSSYDAISEYLAYSAPPYTLPNRHHRHQPMPNCNSLPKMTREKSKSTRPHIGETRSIVVETDHEPLGIQIESGRNGGIFVSAVGDDSHASRAGIEIGDQLLEVCGINMRKATKHLASSVLRQCVESITMLVQYNPDKFHDHNLTDSDESQSEDDESRDNFNRGSSGNRVRASNATITPETFLTHMTFGHSSRTPEEPSSSPEPRVIVRKKLHPHDSVGLELVGGNAVGIFVKSVLPGSPLGGQNGLGIGDQILEFNNKDFRGLTLEQAIVEVSKPCEQVVCCVQYSSLMFLRTETQAAGDAFYVQALYSRSATGDSELSFERGDKLFIENTVLSGRMGTWWAYLVNENGDKLKCGTIPSKTKLEEELLHKRSLADISSSCQTSGPARRSFFHRHRHRNNSRDSHELSSFSDASLNSDSVHHLEDMPLPTLERIEKFDNSVLRPILIAGAFAEQVVKKLTSESPDKFCRHDTEMTFSNEETAVVEYRTASDGLYKVISIPAIQQIMKQNRHCLLTVPLETVEKLQRARIYPIVLFIKYKSQKQIREMKDARFIPEKVSSKMAKDLFEQGQEYEQKYKRIFAETIPGGNLALICCEIKRAIDKEQKRTLWIPVTTSN